MNDTEHPARRAARLSRQYVASKDREGWLGLYAEDAIIEDPIGVSPIDPAGLGHRGAEARAAFWDQFIAPANIDMRVLESFAAGLEVANRVEIQVSMDLGDDRQLQQTVNGIITYRVDERGKLQALRAYWEFDDPAHAPREVELAAGA